MLVASDTSDISQTTAHIGLLVVLIGAGAALLAALLAAALTRRGLRPLRRLAAGAGEIERTPDPSQPAAFAGGRDEIGQLTGVLNRMLASLEAARAGERRFLADASHELRTPVTTLLGNVEFAARHGADPEVLEELQRDARRLARLVDDLLALERATPAFRRKARSTSSSWCVGSRVLTLPRRRGRAVAGSGWPESITRSCAAIRMRWPARSRTWSRTRWSTGRRAAGSRSRCRASTEWCW